MASGMGSVGARLGAAAQIVAAIAALFAASALIGSLVVPHLPQALKTPVLALALWGGVLAGAIMLAVSKTSFGAIGFTPPKRLGRCLLWTMAAIVVSEAGAVAIGELLKQTTDWAPLDVAYIRDSIRGNLTAYIVWIGLVYGAARPLAKSCCRAASSSTGCRSFSGAGRQALSWRRSGRPPFSGRCMLSRVRPGSLLPPGSGWSWRGPTSLRGGTFGRRSWRTA